MKSNCAKTQLRALSFTRRTATRIWYEAPSPENPYIAEACRCHGYDLLELIQQRSFVDVLYLLLRGELPLPEQSRLLEALMVALINPGPRHPATRAAMNAGIGKTSTAHILPISLSILGGCHLGGGEAEAAMRFLIKQAGKDPERVASELLHNAPPSEGDWHIAPGFGSRFSGIDTVPQKIASVLKSMPGSGKALHWGWEFVDVLKAHGLGWLMPGVAAGVFVDLGFHPRAAAGLFQLASAPGLLAHSLDLAHKPITAMPFIDQEHYVIEPIEKG
jgi:citrate synthase